MGKIVGSILEPFTGAKATQRAAETAAQQQAEAAKQAGYAAAFRPVGLTTRFGASRFTEEIDPITGLPRVTGAEYELSPELRAIQDQIFGLVPGALTAAQEAQAAAAPLGMAAQGLFGLGSRIIPSEYDPTAAAQDYYAAQQAMLDPTRQREEQRLASSVFGRGRAGLSVGDVGQPELFSLASARRQQDLALADLSRERARQELQQDIGLGTGLFGTGASLLGQQYGIPTQALGPVQSYLGTAESIEGLGQQPFQLGMQVGGAAQQGGAQGGQLLGAGLQQAAQTRFQGVQQANAANAALLGGLIGAGANAYGMSRMGAGSLFGSPATSLATGGGYMGGITPGAGMFGNLPAFNLGSGVTSMGPSIYSVAPWAGSMTSILGR